MTDKQIIIDGVDVSKCSYHYEHTRVCLVKMDAAGRYYNCANWHDCDFKKLSQQLKHKEQECEKAKQNAQDTYDLWQALIESFNILQGEKIKLEQECWELKKTCDILALKRKRDFSDYQFQNNELKQQLDQLKEELTISNQENEEGREINAELKETNEGLLSIQYKLADNNKKLRQTLAEIKEIAQEVYNDEETQYQASGVCYEIIQKINEVENEN